MAIRVYDLAKEYDINSKEFVLILKSMNINIKNHMSAMSDQQEKYFRNNFDKETKTIKIQQRSTGKKDAPVKPASQRVPASPASSSPSVHGVKKENIQQPHPRTSPSAPASERRSPVRASGDVPRRRPNPERSASSNKPGFETRNQRPYTQGGGGDASRRRPAQSQGGNASRIPSRDQQNQRRGSFGAGRSAESAPMISGKNPNNKFAHNAQDRNKKDKKEFAFEKDAKFSKKNAKGKKDTFKKPIDNTKKTKGIRSDYKKKQKVSEGVPKDVPVMIQESITVGELAAKLGFGAAEITKILMNYGVMAGINQSIDFETAEVVADELGYTLVMEKEEDFIANLLAEHTKDPSQLKLRAPIITVMGHVDHGKTSLLDAIRHTNVISGEAGGITQHIGAYTVNYKDHMITFIDTPGHEAFTAMRSRGASVTDIAILVVAADDGVMPQTIEAINHAKDAKVPIIVAINKIDKPEANPERVKQELTEYGLVAEEWGGDTICVEVSAKSKQGIEQLLEMILLVSEVEELKANDKMPALGTIIESRLDKQRGATLTMLVQSGTLHTSDLIVCGAFFGKVRAMYDDKGKIVKSACPSTPVEVIGFPEVVSAGDKFFVVESEKEARKITQRRKNAMREKMSGVNTAVSLDDLFNQISQGELKELKLIIKADVDGSCEALKQSLEKLNDNEDGVKVSVIHTGVGAVNESDVVLAAASGALIIAFNVRPNANAKAMSQKEGVEIRMYRVIYQVTEEIEQAMKGMLDPEFKEVHVGEAQVRQTFRLPGGVVIAGCYVSSGTIYRKNPIRIIRDGVVVYEGNLSSLRRVKDDVREVNEGYECGMGIEKYNDVKEGDVIESYEMQEVKRN